jgi:hypothetical protein
LQRLIASLKGGYKVRQKSPTIVVEFTTRSLLLFCALAALQTGTVEAAVSDNVFTN